MKWEKKHFKLKLKLKLKLLNMCNVKLTRFQHWPNLSANDTTLSCRSLLNINDQMFSVSAAVSTCVKWLLPSASNTVPSEPFITHLRSALSQLQLCMHVRYTIACCKIIHQIYNDSQAITIKPIILAPLENLCQSFIAIISCTV